MTITDKDPKTLQKLRRELSNALASSFISEEDISPVLDDTFEIVTKTVRRHFGISTQEAELMLADARNEAGRLIGRYHLNDLVNLDEAIDAVAEYLAAPGAVT